MLPDLLPTLLILLVMWLVSIILRPEELLCWFHKVSDGHANVMQYGAAGDNVLRKIWFYLQCLEENYSPVSSNKCSMVDRVRSDHSNGCRETRVPTVPKDIETLGWVQLAGVHWAVFQDSCTMDKPWVAGENVNVHSLVITDCQ